MRRNPSRAKEQDAADASRWWLKGCFCLSSIRTTYTALFITSDSELEWSCRKSVQDERCIKVVDYSLVVDVAMDGLPTGLNRALFAAMSGTTWVRPLFGERGRGLCIIWFTVSSVLGLKINARRQRHVGALGKTLGTSGAPRIRDDSGQTHSADTLHPQTLSAIESEMT